MHMISSKDGNSGDWRAKRIGRGIALRLSEGRRARRDSLLVFGSRSPRDRGGMRQRSGVSRQPRKVAEIERLFADVQQHFGKLDGLVNNAARFTQTDPLEITEADWDFIHSVNLKATFFCCQQGAQTDARGLTAGGS